MSKSIVVTEYNEKKIVNSRKVKIVSGLASKHGYPDGLSMVQKAVFRELCQFDRDENNRLYVINSRGWRPATVKDMAKILGYSNLHMYRHLKKFKDMGLISIKADHSNRMMPTKWYVIDWFDSFNKDDK